MPKEEEKPAFWEKLLNVVLRKTVDNFVDSFDHYSKKFVRSAALILGGIAIAMLGIAAIAVGVAKGLTLFLPAWLAWVIVGVLLMLIGTVLVAVNK
ncbi:MAG TPA: phage holin family protein [Methylomirabilota bacterium]|nr:phage holin family protein [Methylomirabilota bacterium]